MLAIRPGLYAFASVVMGRAHLFLCWMISNDALLSSVSGAFHPWLAGMGAGCSAEAAGLEAAISCR